MTHYLKTWPDYFDLVQSGQKTFEVRKHDRAFMAGDMVCLQEWRPTKAGNLGPEGYTGRTFWARIQYVLTDFPGITEGYCVFGLKE